MRCFHDRFGRVEQVGVTRLEICADRSKRTVHRLRERDGREAVHAHELHGVVDGNIGKMVRGTQRVMVVLEIPGSVCQ